ncbi:MAG: class I SAM-dependent methyltransferase [Aeromicrobium sp.]
MTAPIIDPVIEPAQAMDAAFAGRACQLIDQAGTSRPMALRRWTGTVDATDRTLLLERCRGRTLDVGCGPGRLVAGLATLDVPALGIDVSHEAVRQSRQRGALAIRRNVFASVPGEGRWDCALLADGNIGIGGHPGRLLGRIRRIVRAGGRVVVELDAAGTDIVHQRWRLRVGSRVTPVFTWAAVGLDAIERLADSAGFVVEDVATVGDRHAAVLRQVPTR